MTLYDKRKKQNDDQGGIYMKPNTNDNHQKKAFQNGDNKKIRNFIENQKKKNIYLVLLILVLLVLILPLIIHSYIQSKKSASENVTEYIEKLGKKFYEDYYYQQLSGLKGNHMVEDTSTFLENFVTSGIPVTLNQVLELHFKTEKQINKAIKKYQCDFETTGFIIYPEPPYEKKSYRIEPHISCQNLGSEKKENNQ